MNPRDLAYLAAATATAPLWLLGMARAGKLRTDWPGRFARGLEPLPPAAPGVRTLLLYGVSVGEVNALRGLVAALEADPTLRLVVAAMTDTGVARARQLFGDRHRVARFPYDLSGASRRFLNALDPDAVALVELEVWPNFLQACDERDVPVVVINGRLSERSFRRYRKVRRLLTPSFARLAGVAAQSDAYAGRFVALGAPPDRVRTLGNLKWDSAPRRDDPAAEAAADRLLAELGIDPQRPLVVAGSTAPGEERLVLNAVPAGTQLLIAPRKPEWFAAAAAAAPHAVRRTQPDAARPASAAGAAPVFLLDTIGELGLAYRRAAVAIVGRSFTGRLHGSDFTEPVALGVPTVVGPHHRDFADAAGVLLPSGGLVVADDPGPAVRRLLADPAAARRAGAAGARAVDRHRGVTRRYVAFLHEHLKRVPATPGG